MKLRKGHICEYVHGQTLINFRFSVFNSSNAIKVLDFFQHYPRPSRQAMSANQVKYKKCSRTSGNGQIIINRTFILANFLQGILWFRLFRAKIDISKNCISFLASQARKNVHFSNFSP